MSDEQIPPRFEREMLDVGSSLVALLNAYDNARTLLAFRPKDGDAVIQLALNRAARSIRDMIAVMLSETIEQLMQDIIE